MTESTRLLYCPTVNGYVVRVLGKGTLQQSPVLRDFTLRCANVSHLKIVLDLSQCGYLDSTFLGCLVGLHQNCNPQQNRRFLVHVGSEECSRRLFGVTQIQNLLHYIDALPEPLDDFREISGEVLSDEELGRHVKEAHERLARLGGPDADRFQSVADQIAADLKRRH